jgi:hypothetical protein
MEQRPLFRGTLRERLSNPGGIDLEKTEEGTGSSPIIDHLIRVTLRAVILLLREMDPALPARPPSGLIWLHPNISPNCERFPNVREDYIYS